jgi:hypothetical protein
MLRPNGAKRFPPNTATGARSANAEAKLACGNGNEIPAGACAAPLNSAGGRVIALHHGKPSENLASKINSLHVLMCVMCEILPDNAPGRGFLVAGELGG